MPSAKNYDDDEDNNFDGDERKTRVRRRHYFPTRLGGLCVNAKTGCKYHWRQGSFEEMRLYKVIDATAYYDKDGFRRKPGEPVNKDPIFLYYDSPREYARHNNCELNQNLVDWWNARREAAFPDGNFNLAAYKLWITKNPRWVQSRPSKVTTGVSDEEW